MGAKSNFNQATYELFGIGSKPEEEQKTAVKGGNEPVPAQHSTIERVTPETSLHQDTSYIAAGSVFEGSLKTQGNVNVAGEFHGDICAEGRVELHTNIKGNITAKELELINCKLTGDLKVNDRFILGAQSSVKGKVLAKAMECGGTVEGDVIVENELTLKSCAEIKGNIHTASMIMERGAKVHGSIEMGSVVNTETEKKGSEEPCEEQN